MKNSFILYTQKIFLYLLNFYDLSIDRLTNWVLSETIPIILERKSYWLLHILRLQKGLSIKQVNIFNL